MKNIFAAVSFFAALATPGLSHAAPIALFAQGSSPDVIQVAGGCGPGWHRGPYGGCRRNWANPAAHACPRGFHIGPGGRCRGNGR